MPDVIDFLVLQQFYNEAKEHNWQPGECFEVMCLPLMIFLLLITYLLSGYFPKYTARHKHKRHDI